MKYVIIDNNNNLLSLEVDAINSISKHIKKHGFNKIETEKINLICLETY